MIKEVRKGGIMRIESQELVAMLLAQKLKDKIDKRRQ